jgi:hypothetical protein
LFPVASLAILFRSAKEAIAMPAAMDFAPWSLTGKLSAAGSDAEPIPEVRVGTRAEIEAFKALDHADGIRHWELE